MAHNKIENALSIILQPLFTSANLKTIDLSNNKINDSGLEKIAQFLSTNKSISQLNLNGNCIRDKGVEMICEGVGANSSLKELKLESNKFGRDGFLKIAEMLSTNKSLEKLYLGGNKLVELEAARKLSLSLQQNQTLLLLSLHHSNIDDSVCTILSEGISKNETISHFNLSHNNISCEGSKSLFVGLCSNFTVKALFLSNNNLALNSNQASQLFGEFLRVNHSIERLDLSSCQLGEEGCKAVFKALNKTHSLQTLSLSNNKMGNNPCKQLSNCLSNNNSLTSLHLNSNAISGKGVKQLLEGLHSNSSLQILSLSHNSLSQKSSKLLSSSLSSHSSLSLLFLSHNYNTKHSKLAPLSLSSLSPFLLIAREEEGGGEEELLSKLKGEREEQTYSLQLNPEKSLLKMVRDVLVEQFIFNKTNRMKQVLLILLFEKHFKAADYNSNDDKSGWKEKSRRRINSLKEKNEKGIVLWKDKRGKEIILESEFERKVLNGEGSMMILSTRETRTLWEGEWRNSEGWNGKGRSVWRDSEGKEWLYEGSLKEGKPDGEEGLKIDKENKKVKWEGEWRSGMEWSGNGKVRKKGEEERRWRRKNREQEREQVGLFGESISVLSESLS